MVSSVENSRAECSGLETRFSPPYAVNSWPLCSDEETLSKLLFSNERLDK